jgi:hypothetical protein
MSCVVLLSGQQATLVPAERVSMPGVGDSNSPSHWTREGRLVVYNSDGTPSRSEGDDQFSLGEAVKLDFPVGLAWIESTWSDGDGVVYAWYHHETLVDCGELPRLSVPTIGAAVSKDDGITFEDLGIVLSPDHEPNCAAQNGYFAGGHGDFTVTLDRQREYFYFHYSNYGGDVSTQGVSVARMAFADRDEPVGAVWKASALGWTEPGNGGATLPVFPAEVDWARPDAEAFWGASVHWNTHLNSFVMLLNRTCCWSGWPQEGIYVSYLPDIASPGTWTWPVKIKDTGGWYPQVMGLEPGGTDKVAGREARFYIMGVSEYTIVFEPLLVEHALEQGAGEVAFAGVR